MKRLTQFVLALVMMIQGMQMAVAAVSVPSQVATKLTPKAQRAIGKFVDSVILAARSSKADQIATAQLRLSPTLPRTVSVLPLSKAGGLINAKWTAVADDAEAKLGLKAGTPLVVSSESLKLTKQKRADLKKAPQLTKRLYPGSLNGTLQPGLQARVTFQKGEMLRLSGTVAPRVRALATVVMEEASILSDGTLSPWYATHTLTPDAKNGRFAQDLLVRPGSSAVRARLEVTRKNPQAIVTTAGTGMISTPVSTSDMPFNTFGITTPPWQVANNQGFDNNGNYYESVYPAGSSTSEPVDGTPIVWQGITFPIGPVPTNKNQVGGKEGPKNVVHAAEQTITMPAGSFDWLYLAGAGANGNQTNQPFTLNFSDGSTETWTQSFTDWGNNGNTAKPQPFAGESVILEQSYRINQLGNTVALSTYTYGYTHHIPKGKILASLTLPNNNNLGILSVVGATAPPIDAAKVKSYLLGQINLTGTDLVSMQIKNSQTDPLTFSMANWPENGCNPSTDTNGCNYSTGKLTVNQNQSKTVTYVAPTNWNNIGFSMQRVAGGCVDNSNGCATYTPNWNSGVNGTNCSDENPSPGESMVAGQSWTMTIQARPDSAFNGVLYSPQVSNLQKSNGKGNLLGCVFGVYTKFGNALSVQPGWAKWLEAAIGVAILVGVSFVTFGAPEELAETIALEEAGADVIAEGGIVEIEVEGGVVEEIDLDTIDEELSDVGIDVEYDFGTIKMHLPEPGTYRTLLDSISSASGGSIIF